MDSFEFECPLCNGCFSAAVADVEGTCPHCDENVSLSVVEPSSANVNMVAKRIATPEPLFPPGHKKLPVTKSSATPETSLEPLPVIIMDDGVKKSADDMEPITSPATVPAEFPAVVITDDADDVGESSVSTETDTAIDDLLPPGFQLDDQQIETHADSPEITEAVVPAVFPAVVITDDADDVDESTVSTETDAAIDDLLPPGFQLEDQQIETHTAPQETTEAVVPAEFPAVVITDDADDVDESPVRTETDTAIDDLLPPGFQLDDQQIETHIDSQVTTEAVVIVDVRVDTEPATVGRGINRQELRSRTPDEKRQFMRKKNLIVWAVGALIIIVTMVVMLQLT
jgi:hypothetical protein